MSNQKTNRLVLSVETATRAGSLAVLENQRILSEWRGADNFSHSSELILQIKQVLRQAEIELKQLNLLAAVVGPGSFTGLRVGLATFKALATTLKISLIGIPTLEAMAAAGANQDLVCAILHHGRDNFFYQIYAPKNDQPVVGELRHNSITSILTELNDKPQITIVAAPEVQQIIERSTEQMNLKSRAIIAPPDNLAAVAGKIALQKNRADYQTELSLIYGRAAATRKDV